MRHVIASLTALLLAAPAAAQTTPPPPLIKAAPELERRIAEIVPILNGGGDYAATFAPAFIAAVPKPAFDGISRQLGATAGKALRVEEVKPVTPHAANIVIVFERGRATAAISVEATGAQQVNGLRITGMAGNETSLSAVDAELAKLPGKTGFVLAKLGTGAPELLTARGADTPFAIGSEFKLVILAELVRGIAAGERTWDDTVTLDGGPLPGGSYTQSPAGTKVTLYDLAEKMISISDNSATDIMLNTLGRDKVEAMLPVIGVANPKGMRPFLATLEAFKLKSNPLGARWASADETARRALLSGEVAAMPITAIDNRLFAKGKPLQIDQIEWFATPADMIRVMDWLRRHSETGSAARARAILAKNSGIGSAAAGKWQYLGFKGGSEPGVIAMTFLLQGKDSAWYALSASWNDTAAAVDDARFAGLMTSAVELAAGG
ncbi:serine hydrolase [Sphingomonas sp. PB4P5]|uniref:serine hydrolase n=1 Tax=Parasphingomonas puruogangriensis TaxID=3096155 RepID=UPI002FCC6B11